MDSSVSSLVQRLRFRFWVCTDCFWGIARVSRMLFIHSFLLNLSLFALSFCTKNDSLFTKYYSFSQFRREVSKRYFVIPKGYFF